MRLLSLLAVSIACAHASADDDQPSPEMKAIIKTALSYLKEKKAEDRVKGADMLAELGENAKGNRRDLCEALVDKNAKVRVAAADAMKKIDAEACKTALKIIIDRDYQAVNDLRTVGTKAAHFTPLVLDYLKYTLTLKAGTERIGLMVTAMRALTAIGPDDETANNAVLSGITSTDYTVRLTAVEACTTLTYAKKHTKTLLKLSQTDELTVRLAAIEALVAVADTATRKQIESTLSGMRFDKEERVRESVEKALITLAK
ncbi:HEAT repeat domain-containing protein [Limnoglobus roseus]|uniref:HEAT repeat domain-containing protein n=1 Tax=Limnoglobus roseus TaxID=2598579 RepID=A0A5C1AGV1_9BACT|nr:HEAT repeat domain-containing protein [Limnoglobus roseus]QEL17387.1 hypothetical protein PX52LOC_04374 [Limnoglobus roseus]